MSPPLNFSLKEEEFKERGARSRRNLKEEDFKELAPNYYF
jgi:hypothetical protein